MSTNANIIVAIKPEDRNKVMKFDISKLPEDKGYASDFIDKIGTVKPICKYLVIYHHWDGYPEGLGKCLVEEFNSYDKALNLVLGGYASTIIGKEVIQYCAWRGEDWDEVMPKPFDWEPKGANYRYKFENDTWYIHDEGEWKELKSFLESSKR